MDELAFLNGQVKIVLGNGSASVEDTLCEEAQRDTPFGYAIDGFAALLASLCSLQPDLVKHPDFEESLQSAIDAISNHLGEN